MSTVAERFNKFLSNIQLTSTQIQDAKTKYNGVCKKLHNHYYASSYDGSTKLLVGSYGKNTAIAPPTDIDVLFIMPYEKFDRYNSYSANGQSQLLQDIKNILLERYPDTYMRGDGQVVMVNFVSYNVEVIPCFSLNGHYYIPDTHSGGSWKETSPKSEMDDITNSNKRSKGNTVKLIKMIKAWKYYCSAPIKSFVIELGAVNFLKMWNHYDKSSVYYDWMIRDFFRELLEYVKDSCKIPGINEKISYGDEWESKARTALTIAEKACAFESEKDNRAYRSATQEWKKIFGDRFEY
jgi:hypothetical protein